MKRKPIRTKQIYKWHQWCGLVVGILLLMMSLTGSLLVFSDEIETAVEKKPATKTAGGIPSFDASFQHIRRTYPEWEIRMYHLPKTGTPLVYDLRKKEQSLKIYADPVSGEILDVNPDANRSFQRQLLLLHYTLLSGTTGKIIIFFTGVLFFIVIVTGLVVYRRFLWKAVTFQLKINRKNSRSFFSSLHRIAGVWSLLFNLLIVCTGLWLSGNIALNAVKKSKASAAETTTLSITSVDAVVKTLQSEMPDYEIHLLRSRPGTALLQASGRLTSDPAWYGEFYSVLQVDASTANITSAKYMKDLPAGQRLSKMAGPLHFGNFGGLPLKILYSLLGLTPGFLSLTGFLMWQKRKRAGIPVRRKQLQLAELAC